MQTAWLQHSRWVKLIALHYHAGAEPIWGANFGEGIGPIVLNNVNCNPNKDTLLQDCSSHSLSDNCHHGKDAGVRCQIDSRIIKNISASSVASTGTVHTVLIIWELQNNTLYEPYLFEVECSNEQHKIVMSVSNKTFSTQLQGLLPSTSYTCCILAIYIESDDHNGAKRICTIIKTPGLPNTQENFSTTAPAETVASDKFMAPDSVSNTVSGVLGSIIAVLLVLLAICGVALMYLLRQRCLESVISKR